MRLRLRLRLRNFLRRAPPCTRIRNFLRRAPPCTRIRNFFEKKFLKNLQKTFSERGERTSAFSVGNRISSTLSVRVRSRELCLGDCLGRASTDPRSISLADVRQGVSIIPFSKVLGRGGRGGRSPSCKKGSSPAKKLQPHCSPPKEVGFFFGSARWRSLRRNLIARSTASFELPHGSSL